MPSFVPRHRAPITPFFGLTSDPCRPFHYYGPSKAKCTNAVPTQNDEHVHWFEREHEIYAEWQRRGVVSLHS